MFLATTTAANSGVDEHWYVNYVAGHHVWYDVFLNDPVRRRRTEKLQAMLNIDRSRRCSRNDKRFLRRSHRYHR